MKGKRESISVDINLSGDEWFIGDEEWNCPIIQVFTPENKISVMKRVPTPYPSYESFPEISKFIEPVDADNFFNIWCCWFSKIGDCFLILYKKLLFK